MHLLITFLYINNLYVCSYDISNQGVGFDNVYFRSHFVFVLGFMMMMVILKKNNTLVVLTTIIVSDREDDHLVPPNFSINICQKLPNIYMLI